MQEGVVACDCPCHTRCDGGCCYARRNERPAPVPDVAGWLRARSAVIRGLATPTDTGRLWRCVALDEAAYSWEYEQAEREHPGAGGRG